MTFSVGLKNGRGTLDGLPWDKPLSAAGGQTLDLGDIRTRPQER